MMGRCKVVKDTLVRPVVKRHTSFARPVLSVEKLKHCFTCRTIHMCSQACSRIFAKTCMLLVSVVHALTHDF